MRNKPDFSKETMRIKLPIPFKYKGPKDKEENLIIEAEITKMAAPEIARIKGALAALSDEKLSYATAIKEIIDNSVTNYYNIGGEEITSATLVVLNQLIPVASADKAWRFAALLTRGTSLLPTAYKCPETNQSILFNLDPEEEVPEDIEKDRAFMEDYMDFYKEKAIKDPDLYDGFSVDFKKPVKLESIDEDGEIIDIFGMESMFVSWPAMRSFLKNMKDAKRSKNAETWILFENIKRINEFTEEETQRILKHNGHDKVMRIDPSDWRSVLKKLDEFGVMNGEHEYSCVHCGGTHEDTFDMTNFFDFLKR